MPLRHPRRAVLLSDQLKSRLAPGVDGMATVKQQQLPLAFEDNFDLGVSALTSDQEKNGHVSARGVIDDVVPASHTVQQDVTSPESVQNHSETKSVVAAAATANNAENVQSLSNGSAATSAPGSDAKNLLLAATYIEDAMLGRTLEYNTDEESLKHYRFYSNFWLRNGTVLVMWLLLILAIFEQPAIHGAEIPYWGTIIMELACLAEIVFRLYQLSRFVPRRVLLTDPKNIVIALTIVITIADMIVYIGMINSPAEAQAIRVSRCLRPLFLINMNESKQVRRAFRNIRNTVPEIIHVLILFIFSIALFTLLAFKLFENRDLAYYNKIETEAKYFKNYWDSFFDLYVLVTTANSPDVMMPAYNDSEWFALFFIVYIIINTYIFMNLFLAVIYNSYRNNLRTEIRAAVLSKRKKLDMAFELLCEETEDGSEPVVRYQTWIDVMNTLVTPPSFRKVKLYWEVLKKDADIEDSTRSGIVKGQFLQVADLLNVYVVEDASSVNVFLKLAPEVYESKPSRFVRKCVRHQVFIYTFDLLIIANAICIGLNEEDSEWFFLSVFILEILLKIYTLGPREYFSFERLWNWFDFTIIVAAFIATVVEASLDELTAFPREALDLLLVLRCLRLVRITGNIQRFRIVLMTIVNIAPSLLTYGIVLLMLYYAFAIVGMESFGGKIKYVNGTFPEVDSCGNPALQASDFARMNYCKNNFNDILRSLVTLVELTVVNQWHVITSGFVRVTNKGARVYFILFHLIVVILIMNIIVAFVLEAFILEYSISKTTIESQVERTIAELGFNVDVNISEFVHDKTRIVDGADEDLESEYVGRRNAVRDRRPNIQFRINEGHKSIEVLLQKMFEGELEGEAPSSNPDTGTRVAFDDVPGTSSSA